MKKLKKFYLYYKLVGWILSVLDDGRIDDVELAELAKLAKEINKQ